MPDEQTLEELIWRLEQLEKAVDELAERLERIELRREAEAEDSNG